MTNVDNERMTKPIEERDLPAESALAIVELAAVLLDAEDQKRAAARLRQAHAVLVKRMDALTEAGNDTAKRD